MSGKKKTATASANLQTLKTGSRVRCTDDGVEGRITWANATALKIEWADGEKVTWKRADLASKGLEAPVHSAQRRRCLRQSSSAAIGCKSARIIGSRPRSVSGKNSSAS